MTEVVTKVEVRQEIKVNRRIEVKRGIEAKREIYPAEQKISLLTCSGRQALVISPLSVKSNSYVPVAFGTPVPLFSMTTTLPLIPAVVIRGMTTPPIRNWYDPAAEPVGVFHV